MLGHTTFILPGFLDFGAWGIWPLVFLLGVTLPFALSAALIPLCIKIAHKFNILDQPGPRKVHHQSTPLTGGIAIVGSMVCSLLGLAVLAHYAFVNQDWAFSFFTRLVGTEGAQAVMDQIHNLPKVQNKIFVISIGGMLIWLVGFIDDVRELSPKFRLIAGAAVSTFVVTSGIKPDFFGLPLPLVWAMGVIWMVGIINSLNLIDGLNGLASGVSMIAAVIFSFVMIRGHQPQVALILTLFTGAVAGFFIYNFPKGKIFLGSNGAIFLGYFLGVAVLLGTYDVYPEEGSALPVAMPLFILGVPLYDTFSVMVIRLIKGKPIMEADQSHLAHRLCRMGFSAKQAVLFVFLFTFCVGINATLLLDLGLAHQVIVIVQILAIFGIIILLERHKDRRQYTRVPSRIDAQICLEGEQGLLAPVEAVLLDVSEDGLGLVVPNPVDALRGKVQSGRNRVQVYFATGVSGANHTVKGILQWSKLLPDQETTGHNLKFGIEVTHWEPATQAWVQKIIHRNV